jgi:hypothetical protein
MVTQRARSGAAFGVTTAPRIARSLAGAKLEIPIGCFSAGPMFAKPGLPPDGRETGAATRRHALRDIT